MSFALCQSREAFNKRFLWKMMISVRFSLNQSSFLLDLMQNRDDNCYQSFTKLILSIEFFEREISFLASQSNFWNLTHHSHYEFMNAKHFWGAAKTMNTKKMQQISILPFLICLSGSRRELRFEEIMNFSAAHRMQFLEECDAINHSTSWIFNFSCGDLFLLAIWRFHFCIERLCAASPRMERLRVEEKCAIVSKYWQHFSFTRTGDGAWVMQAIISRIPFTNSSLAPTFNAKL